MSEIVDAVLVADATKTVNTRVTLPLEPSFTVTVIAAEPVPDGDVLRRMLPLLSGLVYVTDWTVTRAALLETALTSSVWTSFVAPEPTPVKFTWNCLFSTTVMLAIGSSVGRSFDANTVTENCVVAIATPSLTVSVMSDVPCLSALGIITALRFVPYPLITILLFAISTVFDEFAVTDKSAEPSGSPTVNGTTTGVSSAMTTLSIVPIVGE